MYQSTEKLTIAQFWEIKKQIDTEVARLGWSKDYCKDYILKHYSKRSRLSMTDSELRNLLDRLQHIGTPTEKDSLPVPKNNRREKRRRRQK